MTSKGKGNIEEKECENLFRPILNERNTKLAFALANELNISAKDVVNLLLDSISEESISIIIKIRAFGINSVSPKDRHLANATIRREIHSKI